MLVFRSVIPMGVLGMVWEYPQPLGTFCTGENCSGKSTPPCILNLNYVVHVSRTKKILGAFARIALDIGFIFAAAVMHLIQL